MKIDPRSQMNESEIKAIVLSEMRRLGQISRNSVVANEYQIGGSSTRADLAISERDFIGIEIKSELDSLKRLNHQIVDYKCHFDRVILVVSSKHRQKIPDCIKHLAEIWEIDRNANIHVVSHPGELFDEAVYEAASPNKINSDQKGVYSPVFGLSRDAVDRTSIKVGFRARFEATSLAFWRSVGRRNVRVQDLDLLSRFKERRLMETSRRAQSEALWLQWSLTDRAA